MKVPSLKDRCVVVSAWLTDEEFGYEHWRAAQFAPPAYTPRWGALVLFETKEEAVAFNKNYSAPARESAVPVSPNAQAIQAELDQLKVDVAALHQRIDAYEKTVGDTGRRVGREHGLG